MPKPRSDARLKTLPLPQQCQIVAWLNSHSQTQTCAFIKSQFGVLTSPAALSRFYADWHDRHPLAEWDAFVQATQPLAETSAALEGKLDALQQSAFALFQLQAVKERDFNLFLRLCRLRAESRKPPPVAEAAAPRESGAPVNGI